jgi:hypothetical protein
MTLSVVMPAHNERDSIEPSTAAGSGPKAS